MKILHLPSFPLDSLALIEASAGTGKTYALANLYLRYLLERQLTVEQILVVTFTEAATQELKDRIRVRIHSLLAVFDGRPASDEIELHLLQQSADQAADRLRLRLAERQLDQAEIHTIHGFCQRLLRQHALESRVPLQQTLIEDQRPLLQQVLEDFWRSYVLTLDRVEIEFICTHWSGPMPLLKAILPLLQRQPQNLVPTPEVSGLASWRDAFKRSRKWFAELQSETRSVIDEVLDVVARSELKDLNRKLNWLQQVRVWSEQELTFFCFPSTSSKANLFEEFVPGRLAEQTKAKGVPPQHRYFEFLEQHLAEPLTPLKEQFVVQCFQLAQQGLQQRKQAQGLFGFDDLISQVARALGLTSASSELAKPVLEPHHERFAEAVRQRYRVALIDEFQDTDQAQYHIFSTLFGPKAGPKASRLVLIGDPKQAIYAFRGGDIATYLSAKRELSAHPRGEQFSMDTNWRSAPSMIAAINYLFAAVDQPFMAPDIPFQVVHAGKSEASASQGAALTLSQLDSVDLNKEQILEGLAQLCVARVKQLLGERVNNADIALLVRSGTEGELLKARLAEAGINSTYEGRSSIFATPEAQSLYFLLQAVADPSNEQAIWRCLSETLFGFTDRQFKALNQQASFLSEILSTFERLHRRWLRVGPLAMIREALGSLKVFAHWRDVAKATCTLSGNSHWERSLTNINQLAELLQQQAQIMRGHFALLRWFHAQIVSADAADDDRRLRLESDEQLIRIVTIHKSKGLEYPVVILPFLFSCRLADEAWFYDPQGRLTLDLLGSKENLLKADAERLAEDMRLLYVALTRAKYRCYIGTCAYHSSNKVSAGLAQSAWGYLLFNGRCPELLDDDALARQLAHCQQQAQGALEVERVSFEQALGSAIRQIVTERIVEPSLTDKDVLRNQALRRPITHRWRVQSFTGLMHEASVHQGAPSPKRPSAQIMTELASPPRMHEPIDILTFPKGSRAGTFLHSLFEQVVFATALPVDRLRHLFPTLEPMIAEQLHLSKLVEPVLVERWTRYLTTWLKTVLNYRLLPQCALADLQAQDYVSEMAFHFPVTNLDPGSFNTLLQRFGYDQPALEFSAFEGHFKGAIDLVFRTQGQFYVLDYKSNYLGDLVEAYLPEQLQHAMDEHRYDLQYLIYCLAVHRFLRHRLGESYCYQRDFGGVIYLFLRGLVLPEQTSHEPTVGNKPGVYYRKPPAELIEALNREVAGT